MAVVRLIVWGIGCGMAWGATWGVAWGFEGQAQPEVQARAQAQAWAQGGAQGESPGQAPGQAPGAGDGQRPAPEPEAEQPPAFEEQVVVSASRSEQQLVNAPATVSVVTAETIENAPATNMGDLLRTVPGLNVSQTSARDINLTARGATNTLATSQLALVDGRSVYLDFFGMVMWDFMPTNPGEIRQIEVIRGPASAVWGANAMSGVVNVITKTPRELAADMRESLTIGVGGFGRDVTGRDRGAGSLFYVNGVHAQAVNDRWAYKASAGYFTQDAMPRPVGTLPNRFNTPYPAFQNQGTTQPKFDARVDYEPSPGTRVTFAGGVAGTEGIIYTGIGPFDISTGSRLGYVTTRYERGARRVAFFANLLNGDAANLLQQGADGAPLPLGFDTRTFDVEAGDVRTIGTRHVLSYGGNYRHNAFDITIAPGGSNRNEGGVYLQDEIFLSDRYRWVVGGRVDKFSSIDNAVFSPRTTFLIKPAERHTVRLSFNRAFRAPSFVNNFIDTTIINRLDLGQINPQLAGRVFSFPVRAEGNQGLQQETMSAFEVGYSGIVAGRATLSAAVYWNHTKDGIYFTQSGRYSAATPPPGWPLPPAVLDLIAAAGSPLPSTFTYLNLGSVTDKGLELGAEVTVNPRVNAFVNYSFQWRPTVEGFDISEINLPPRHRFNAGVGMSRDRWFGNLTLSVTDEAFWQDVLDARFAGTTPAYTLLGGGLGARWLGDTVVTSLKVTNAANREVLQHIFGDVSRRQVVGEVRVTF
ncbi:MAG: TonB-dependent receptor plug domain-containing protein [Vicinamibacterales bacterium]